MKISVTSKLDGIRSGHYKRSTLALAQSQRQAS
jgi:hypothetical protein